MKKKIFYFWTDSDESLIYLDQALNRVNNFIEPKNELDIQARKSFQRIVFDKRFTDEDITILFLYFVLLHSRILEKYNGKKDELSKSILQAADNIKEVAHRFRAYFNFQKILLT